MRHPQRWRNLALAGLFGGPLAIAAAFLAPEEISADALRGMFGGLGLLATLIGGVAALVLNRSVKAQRTLERGDGLLARWRIPPDAWRGFLAIDRERNEAAGAIANVFKPRETVPAEGVEILVGKEAISIDRSLHLMPRHGVPEITRYGFDESDARSPFLEFDLLTPVPGDAGSQPSTTPSRLCFPVPVGAQAQAWEVIAYFAEPGPDTPDVFHGPGDGSDAEDLSTCMHCGHQTHRLVSQCPACGAGMLSKRWSRRYGVLLVVLGLPLALGAAWGLWAMLPMLMHPGLQYGGSRFDGTPAQARGVIGIIGGVAVFGALAFGYGLWQILTGKRGKHLVSIMIGIVAALYLMGWWFSRSG